MPDSASHNPRPRTPGMSTMRPPPGSSITSRLTVVCRPLPSPSRTAAVSWTSSPSSRFTRLDFPTPLHELAHRLGRRGVGRRHHDGLHVGADQRAHLVAHGPNLGVVLRQVGLGEHDGHCGARLIGEHELALKTTAVHLREGLGNDDAIEVGGEHLGDRALGGILAHEGAAARKDSLDDAHVMVVGHGDLHAIADNGPNLLALDQRRRVLAAQRLAVREAHQRESPVELHHLPHAPGLESASRGRTRVARALPRRTGDIGRHSDIRGGDGGDVDGNTGSDIGGSARALPRRTGDSGHRLRGSRGRTRGIGLRGTRGSARGGIGLRGICDSPSSGIRGSARSSALGGTHGSARSSALDGIRSGTRRSARNRRGHRNLDGTRRLLGHRGLGVSRLRTTHDGALDLPARSGMLEVGCFT